MSSVDFPMDKEINGLQKAQSTVAVDSTVVWLYCQVPELKVLELKDKTEGCAWTHPSVFSNRLLTFWLFLGNDLLRTQ
jgi:hypothetical protein